MSGLNCEDIGGYMYPKDEVRRQKVVTWNVRVGGHFAKKLYPSLL